MKKLSRTVAIPALILSAATGLAACGGGNLSLPFGDVRVVNAISDSSSLDARATNLPSDINNITVNTASGFRTVPDGTFNLNVTVNAPASPAGFTFNDVDIDRDAETTVYFPGKIVDNSYSGNGFQVQNSAGSIGTGQVEVQAVHAASNAPAAISLYVNAPTDPAPTGIPVNLSYRTGAAPFQIAGGSYRLRITQQGNSVVVFDSGATGVSLAAGARLQVAALNTTDATGTSTGIMLLLIPSDGSTPVAVANTLP